MRLDPFDYSTAAGTKAFIEHLVGIANQIRLFHTGPGTLSEGNMPEYLRRRTHGIVGLLRRLIEDGLVKAMDSGLDDLTTDILDEIPINLGNVPGKDADTPGISPVLHQPETACAADLTRLDPPVAEPDAVTMTVLLQLQQRLVGLLTADGPGTAMSAGAPVPAAHYFADLRATVSAGARGTVRSARPSGPSRTLPAFQHADLLHARHCS